MIIPVLVYLSLKGCKKVNHFILISQLLCTSRKGPEHVINSGKGKLSEERKPCTIQVQSLFYDNVFKEGYNHAKPFNYWLVNHKENMITFTYT